jgi:alpha-tubulin suppressor-like RCC1 family protein
MYPSGHATITTDIVNILTEQHTSPTPDRNGLVNGRGQLGHGDLRSSPYPRLVEELKRRVSQVACGSHHAVCIGDPGAVYTWGAGSAIGQGVFAGDGDQAIPKQVRIRND